MIGLTRAEDERPSIKIFAMGISRGKLGSGGCPRLWAGIYSAGYFDAG